MDVIAGEAKCEFSVDTDITWKEFQGRILTYLDNVDQTIQLACKLSGESGKASYLSNSDDFDVVIGRLC